MKQIDPQQWDLIPNKKHQTSSVNKKTSAVWEWGIQKNMMHTHHVRIWPFDRETQISLFAAEIPEMFEVSNLFLSVRAGCIFCDRPVSFKAR